MSEVGPPPPPPLPAPRPFVPGGLPPELLKEDEYTEKRIQKELQFWLIGAIESENIDMLRSLIKSGVNTNATVQLTKTPLTLALDQDQVSYEVVKLLLEAGADPNLPDQTPARTQPLLVAIQKNLHEIFMLLLARKADVFACDECGNAPVHFAAQFGRMAMLNHILELCPDLNIAVEDNCNKTPFHRACEQQHLTLAARLLERGAVVDCQDKTGWSPLFRAVMFGHSDVVVFLLKHGANVNLRNSKGNTPLHVACRCTTPENCRTDTASSFDFYHRTWKMPTESLKLLVKANIQSHYHEVKLLVNAGADVNARNQAGESALDLILRDEPVVRYLVEAGAELLPDRLSLDLAADSNADEVPEVLQQSAELQSWLIFQQKQQFSLCWKARAAIRRHLAHTKDIKAAIVLLPLPEALKKYIDVVET